MAQCENSLLRGRADSVSETGTVVLMRFSSHGEADDLQVSFIFKTVGGTDHCFRAGEVLSIFRVLNGHCFVLILKNLSVVL